MITRPMSSPWVRPTAALAVLVTVGALCSCSGAPKRTDPIPTDGLAATRAALSAIEMLSGILEEQVPDSPEAREAWRGLAASVDAGRALCDAWEDSGEAPSSWSDWTVRALGFIETLASVLAAAGVPVPSYVGIAVGSLKFLLPLIAAVIGG